MRGSNSSTTLEPNQLTTEAILGLTHQVQALAGMMQTIIPYIPQLVRPMVPQQSTPWQAPQQGRPQSPPAQEEQPNHEGQRRPTIEETPRNTNTLAARSLSHSWNVICMAPEQDIISLDSTDSVKEQLRQVNQRLDEVQREFIKSKEELDESSKGGSPFIPEIQEKPVPANF
ncbi:hypothetical protein B296_00001691 [Ensete ventricosum]|uniref:Uncharacterized protein n=1 Tax=Ensete ventricosum TaxID=4639 RepID=A0A427AD04_ENSVE|nr:hypothetical protein B296_00001691 [Ensete ventricosum]